MTFTTFTTGRFGWRRISIIAGSYSTRRQPPQADAYPLNLVNRYRRAAPMPRVPLVVSLIVWRVPNDTSAESVARISDAEISAIVAASASSRLSPRFAPTIDLELVGLGWTWKTGGGGIVHAATIRRTPTARLS